MKKSFTTALAVAGLVIAGGLAWWLQQAPADPSPAGKGAAAGKPAGAPAGPFRGPGGPVAVEVGAATLMRLVDDAEAVGTIRSRQGVTLRPETSGRIARIGFQEGRPVRKGQLLVQLDDTLQRAQLQQAEAQASIARTQLKRNRELVAQNFVSQSAVDQSAAALEVADAQVALAMAQLARMRVVAPFDGQAGILRVNLGDYLKDGADIVNLEDISQVWVDYRLPERYLDRVKPGLDVDVSVDALPEQRFKARIEALDSQVDSEGRSLLVRARIDNRAGVLRPGMFARTRTVLGIREQAVVVPEEALVPEDGKQYLIKLVDGPKGPVSQRLEAQLGIRVAGKVEVMAGIEPGDRVVTAGQSRLLARDAMAVRIIELTSAEEPNQPVRMQPTAPPAPGMGGSPAAPGEAASGSRPAA